MKENCPFCQPGSFGERKLEFEDENGYWYAVTPREIGTFGEVLIVVKKRDEDRHHITDISDPELLRDDLRLQSVTRGIAIVSGRLKRGLKDPDGRKVDKIYVLTQCEGQVTHLHFQLLPRFQGDPKGNEFLYSCELEEARWQDPIELKPEKRIENGEKSLRNTPVYWKRATSSMTKSLNRE